MHLGLIVGAVLLRPSSGLAPTDSGLTDVETEDVHLAGRSLLDGRFRLLRLLGKGSFVGAYLARDLQPHLPRLELSLACPLPPLPWEPTPPPTCPRQRRSSLVVVKLNYASARSGIARGLYFRRLIGESEHLPALVAEGSGPGTAANGTVHTFRYVVEDFGGFEVDDLTSRLCDAESPLCRFRTINLHLSLDVLLQTLEALRDMHSVGVLHRDVKPENMLIRGVEKVPRVRLTDLGLACHSSGKRRREGDESLGTTYTASPSALERGFVDRPIDDVVAALFSFVRISLGYLGMPWEQRAGLLWEEKVQLRYDLIRDPVYYYPNLPESFYDVFRLIEGHVDWGTHVDHEALLDAVKEALDDEDLPEFAELPECLPDVKSYP